jgi:putative MATE family efflux protein
MAQPRRKARSFDRSIVEGPIRGAVWKLAWPTMLQNVIGGLQGIVDHVMVGNFVGYTGNAAIGVSWQIFLVVMVFIGSLFTGMGVLVARFLSIGVLAPVGYFLAPSLLNLVNAAPAVQAEALPYIRILFVFSYGMMVFFMLSGALRSAGDAKTPLRFGIGLTVLNLLLNIVLIRGLGPIPAFGTRGAAMGTVIAGGIMALVAVYSLFAGRWVVEVHRGMSLRPDFKIIRELFRFGLPAGIQGVAMNVGGVLLLRFIGSLTRSAEAQAAYAIGYTELFSLITWTSVGLMGATAAVAGQNLGAGKPERAIEGVRVASRIGLSIAVLVGILFLTMPRLLLNVFGMDDPEVVEIGVQLLAFLAASGLFITVALTYTGALQGTGDTRSPLYISLVSQLIIPLGLCWILQTFWSLQAHHIWLAIVLGHMTRSTLTVMRFRQGKWRSIEVGIA